MVKVLLTGGTGMCGQNILEHSSAKDYSILHPSSAELNLLNKRQIKDFLRQESPDFIIHTAGLVAGIQFNIKYPVNALVDNSYIGLNLITAAQEAGVSKLLNLASSCMYPRFGDNPLKETSILQGELEPTNEGYGLSKILSTRLCEYISQQHQGLEYKTLIPCNLFGRYDTFSLEFSHMIPAAIQKLHDAKSNNEKTVEIWGDGLARREFMSASDLADLVFYALRNFDDMPQNLNAGLGHDYSINEYYNAAAKVVGFDGGFVNDVTKPAGMKQKLVDVTLLRAFGWKHSLSLEQGLREAYDFYKETLDKPRSCSKVKDRFLISSN
jgi:GDP-L-fucose synthase